MGYTRKNPNRGAGGGGLRLYFSDPPWNSAKLCDTPWKFQSQKPRPMEIPHEFFLDTPGNSTSLLIEPWNFHVLKPPPPPIQIFSGIAQCTNN